MKHKLSSMLLSAFLAGSMVMSTQVAPLKAAAEAQPPYISEVFIAYGQTEEEAKNWLVNNGWEPVEGDFNAGKTSAVFSDVAAVMGIRRTADPHKCQNNQGGGIIYGPDR